MAAGLPNALAALCTPRPTVARGNAKSANGNGDFRVYRSQREGIGPYLQGCLAGTRNSVQGCALPAALPPWRAAAHVGLLREPVSFSLLWLVAKSSYLLLVTTPREAGPTARAPGRVGCSSLLPLSSSLELIRELLPQAAAPRALLPELPRRLVAGRPALHGDPHEGDRLYSALGRRAVLRDCAAPRDALLGTHMTFTVDRYAALLGHEEHLVAEAIDLGIAAPR